MTGIVDWLQSTLGIPPPIQGRILSSLIVIAALWAIRRTTLYVVTRRVEEVTIRYRWRKTSLYAVVTVGILIVGRIWFEGVQSLATFLGLVSAGLAIALKDLVVNLAGWVFIMWRRPFEVGDRVQIGKHGGDVIDLRIFQFTLLEIGNWVEAEQSTGRIIHIPNGKVLTDVLANYSKGFRYIWNEIPVLVTFESNWKKAKNILQDIVERYGKETAEEAPKWIKQATQRFLISYSRVSPTVYTSVADSGVMLTLRYLCNPKERRGSTQQIWESILEAFSECDDIDFAYPTHRFYNNAAEGKPEARAELPYPPQHLG